MSFMEISGYVDSDRNEMIVRIDDTGAVVDIYTYSDMPHPEDWVSWENANFKHARGSSDPRELERICRRVFSYVVNSVYREKRLRSGEVDLQDSSSRHPLARGVNLLLIAAVQRVDRIPGGPIETAESILKFLEQCSIDFTRSELVLPLRRAVVSR